jgi:hypothetical protein
MRVRQPSDITRRDLMMRLGAIGTGAMSLPGLLSAEQTQAAVTDDRTGGRAKSCILIYLWGGPPQQDMFDLKPDAPSGIRSLFNPIETNVPGISISDQLPDLARHADKMAIVRALTHPSNDHVHSVYHTLTGKIDPTLQGSLRQRRRTDFPCVGSIVSSFSPPGDLPNTVTVPCPIGHDGVTYSGTYAGFLGSRHDPLELKAPGEVKAPPPHSLELPSGLDGQRILSRFNLLEQIDASQRDLDQRLKKSPNSMSSFREQALRMLTSPDAKAAFDLERESARMRDQYGRNEYGESFLLARRLVEAGVRLVTVVWYYICPDGNVANIWDNHGGTGSLGGITGYESLKQHYGLPALNRAYSALLDDLAQSGLLDETLVAMYGEFGRTPLINKKVGRDHWGACQSAVFAGGGIRGGTVYGSSDGHAAYPRDHACSPSDVLATMYHSLGLRAELEIHDREGRPYRLCDGTPLPLFG